MSVKVNWTKISQYLVLLSVLVLNGCGSTLTPEEGLQRANDYIQKGNYNAAIIELKNVLLDNPQHLATRQKLGELYLIQRDGASAEKELLKAQQISQTELDVRSSLGRAIFLQGDYSRLTSDIPIEESDPESTRADLLLLRAYADLFNNKPDQAAPAFQQVLAIQPNNAAALNGMAMLELENGNYSASTRHIEQALAVDAGNMDAWVTKGRLALIQNDYSSAEDAFRHAFETAGTQFTFLQPIQAHAYLVQVLIDQKKLDDAAQTVDKIAAKNPGNPIVNYLRAHIAFERSDFEAASEQIQVVRSKAPDYDPALILEGAINYSLGNLERANTSLSAYLSRYPNSNNARILLAKTKLRLQQPEQAYQLISPLLQQQPENLELLLLAGSATSAAGKPDASIPLLERSLQLVPDNRELKLKLASSHLAANHPDEAIRILQSMQPTANEFGQRELLLLLAWSQKKDYDTALRFTEEYLSTHPQDTEVLGHSAVILVRKGDLDAARTRFEKAITLKPDDTLLLKKLAELEYNEKNFSRAGELLEQALKIEPNDAGAIFALANINTKEGNTDQAIALLEQARKASDTAVDPRLMLIKYYIEQGKLDQAREISAETTLVAKNRADVWNTHSVVQNLTGDAEGAVKSLLIAQQLSPESETILMNLARSQVAIKDLGGAKQSLRKILKLSPANYQAAAMLALTEMKQGNSQKAFEIARTQQSIPENRANALSLEGDLQMMAADYNKAIVAYRRAQATAPGSALTVKLYLAYSKAGLERPEDTLRSWLQTHPDDATVRSLLARVYYSNGNTAGAVQQYEMLLSRNPDDPDTLNNLALAYYAQNDPRALQMAEKAHQLNSESAAIKDTLGWMLVQENQVSRGLQLLGEAVKKLPDNSEVQYHYAVALAASGDRSGAQSILQKLAASNSNSPVIEDAKKYLQKISQ